MDATVEALHENLRSLDPSSLEALPNAAKLSSNLKSLEQTISQILPALSVAMKQTERNRKAEEFVQEVTDLAYQLQTLLGEIQSEAQLARDRLRSRSVSTKLMAYLDPNFFTCDRLHKRLVDMKVEFRCLAPMALQFSASANQPAGQDQATIYGRDDDLRNIKERLLSDGQPTDVLRIVGSPGSGKTTLARLAYNDDQLKSKFDIRAWVVVSENFDVRRATQDLLIKLGHGTPHDIRDLPTLQRQLQEHLSSKRFLLIMDHVRKIDSAAWAKFIDPLHSAALEIRVLVTMTHADAALSKGTLFPHELKRYELKGLTDEACWSLLASVAFPDKNPDEYSHLMSIGKKMVHKCEGHPHATKVLGEILRDNMNESDWERVLKSGHWESVDDMRGKANYHLLKNKNQDSSGPRDDYDHHTSPETVRYMSCIYDVSMNFDALSRYTKLRTLLLACSPAHSPAIYSDQVLPEDLFKNFPQLRVLSLSGLPLENLPDSIEQLIHLRNLDLSYTLIKKLPQSITTLPNLLTLKLNNCLYLAEFPSMGNLITLRHLDISGSKNIKAMPPGLGRLTHLRSLSNFIVKGLNESQLQELKDLVHLSGKLSISGLQNVVDSNDAKKADLAMKTSLRELVLEWTTNFSGLRNKDVETEVLEYLKAGSNLEILCIIGYGGVRFPEWISLSHKLVRVTLSNCRNSKNLPLLGQLPQLKELRIEGMSEVISISTEFCGNVSQGTMFPSLETLEFKDMLKWEEWSFGAVEFEGLPRLRFLKVERCPKLREFKVLMNVLEMLTINECQELTAFALGNFPSLRELDIQHCSNLKEIPESFPSLTKLRIWGCQELTSLSKAQQTGGTCEEFPRLLELDIQNCRSLKELPSKFSLLEKLRIRNCKALFELSVFPNLHDLILEECDELMLGNEVEVSSLVSMVISQLPKLVCPSSLLLQCLSRLINLEISKCRNLVALTENGSETLPSLERLVIDGCPKLKQLPDLFSCFSSLKELIIMGCETLEFFPEMALPPAFKRLVIQKCKLLKSLPPKLFDSQDIRLELLEVYGCPSLESLSQSKLPETLRLLSVWDCSSLKSLPRGLNQENTSLTSLRIWDCQSLQDFPHEGLPCNIRSLSVMNCRNLKPLSEWGLKELERLRNFSFGRCPEMAGFMEVMLPDSVRSVLLKGLPEIVSFAGLFDNLKSLDILTIRDCPRLQILAEVKLPDSVRSLHVSNCPMLRERCRIEGGEEWPRIKHIPLKEFDFQAMR